MTVKISGNKDKFTPDDNHPFRWMIVQAASRGVYVDVIGDQGTIDIADHGEITTTVIVGMQGFGLSVSGWPAFIKMSPATYSGSVPSYVPVADESSRPVLWSDWKDSTHNHLDATDGDKIVPGNSLDGTELDGSVIADLVSQGSSEYTVLSSSEVLGEMDGGI